jgi:heme A synthase
MSLITLLIVIIVMGLIYWLITFLPLPAPFRTIAIVVFVVICILILLGFIGVIPSNVGNIRIGR